MNTKKYLAWDKSVRVIAVDATEMVQEIRDIHNLSNVATAAVGRVVIVASMIASTLKNEDDRLTIQIKGEGELGTIVVSPSGEVSVPELSADRL